MRDYLNIGPGPADEPCAQVGSEQYSIIARHECRAYRDALIAHYGPPPGDIVLSVKAFPHDFGTYHEVVAYYDVDDNEQVQYVLRIEEGLDYWPKKQLTQLRTALAQFGIDYDSAIGRSELS